MNCVSHSTLSEPDSKAAIAGGVVYFPGADMTLVSENSDRCRYNYAIRAATAAAPIINSDSCRDVPEEPRQIGEAQRVLEQNARTRQTPTQCTHAQTHTHTHTNTCTHAHTHTHACMHTHAHNRRRTHNRIALSFCAVNGHCPMPLYVKQLQDTAVAPGQCLQKMTQRPLQQNCWSASKWFN